MKEKIRACLLQAHSSVINGIDSDKASNLLEKLFKSELEELLSSADDLWFVDKLDSAALIEFIDYQRNKYKLND